MKVKETKIDEVWLIELDPFVDQRGQFVEIFNKKNYYDLLKWDSINFVQDDISVSRKNVLRGIHGDGITYKLVTCLHGSFYVVVVNCDEKSDQYFKWESHILSDKNMHQLLVSPKRGMGIVALEENSVFHYKQSQYYKGMKAQFTYKWNNDLMNISWPIKEPILSERDSA